MAGETTSGRIPARRGWRETLRTYLDPRLIAVLFMGFSSGLPLALTSGTLQVWQSRDGVDLTIIGFFALVGVSYSLKFLWAPLLDRVPPPPPFARLGQRRGWAILIQLGLMATIVGLGLSDPANSPGMAAVAAIFVAFFSASQDIVIDAYRIELLDEDQQGAGAAMTQYGYRIGMLASGAGALFLADALSWPAVYLIMSGLVSVGIFTILLTREPKAARPATPLAIDGHTRRLQLLAFIAVVIGAVIVFLAVRELFKLTPSPSWVGYVASILAAAATPAAVVLAFARYNPNGPVQRFLQDSVLRPFVEFGSRPGWLLVLMFIVLFKLGDAVAGVMANPFYVAMGFTNTEIASVSKIFGIAATLVGVFLGGLLVARVGIVTALIASGTLQMASNLMFAYQATVGHDVGTLALTIAIENLSGGMGSAAFVAYLSALCNVAFSGTQYALFSSLAAVGRIVLSSPGGFLAQSLGWVSYFVASTILAVPGLLLLIWLVRRYPLAGKVAPPQS